MALNELLDRRNRNNATGEMSMVDHLEALRWHVVRSVIAIVVCAIGCFVFIDPLMDHIIFGPLNKGFITYDLLCQFSHKVLNSETLCLPPPNVQMQTTTFGGQFISSITIAFITGFVIAFPYVLWEIWRFIKPALTKDEIRNTNGAVAFVTFFFLLGIAFGFFLMAPFTFSFLSNYKVGTMNVIETKPVLNDYIDNLVDITVGCGLAFQLPVISYVLSRMGLITPQFLKDYRKYAYVALLMIAAIITPSPDWMSQMIVVLPLILLYEFSILISRKAIKKTEEKALEEWS